MIHANYSVYVSCRLLVWFHCLLLVKLKLNVVMLNEACLYVSDLKFVVHVD